MNDILSIDIETENLSNEIGGWQNTHMFKIACVCTWDGEVSKVYADVPLELDDGIIIKTLRELKYDLDDQFDKGGQLLGHNINVFDLPVLRDSLDIYIAKKYLDKKEEMCIDTSAYLSKNFGKRIHLDNLTKCTLDVAKTMDGIESVTKWRNKQYNDVVNYCIQDTKITYDLYKYGKAEGLVKAFDEQEEEIVTYPCFW